MKSHYSCQVAAAIHNAALSLDGTHLGQGKRQKVCFSVLKDIGTTIVTRALYRQLSARSVGDSAGAMGLCFSNCHSFNIECEARGIS